MELEKSLRPPKKDEKDKKDKKKQQEPVYDHNEGSLHDAALRTRLRLGYEAFKVNGLRVYSDYVLTFTKDHSWFVYFYLVKNRQRSPGAST